MTLSAEDILQMDYDDPLKEYKDKFQPSKWHNLYGW
jgi:hypothetical protein